MSVRGNSSQPLAAHWDRRAVRAGVLCRVVASCVAPWARPAAGRQEAYAAQPWQTVVFGAECLPSWGPEGPSTRNVEGGAMTTSGGSW